jgi:hypothetical protein
MTEASYLGRNWNWKRDEIRLHIYRTEMNARRPSTRPAAPGKGNPWTVSVHVLVAPRCEHSSAYQPGGHRDTDLSYRARPGPNHTAHPAILPVSVVSATYTSPPSSPAITMYVWNGPLMSGPAKSRPVTTAVKRPEEELRMKGISAMALTAGEGFAQYLLHFLYLWQGSWVGCVCSRRHI